MVISKSLGSLLFPNSLSKKCLRGNLRITKMFIWYKFYNLKSLLVFSLFDAEGFTFCVLLELSNFLLNNWLEAFVSEGESCLLLLLELLSEVD